MGHERAHSVASAHGYGVDRDLHEIVHLSAVELAQRDLVMSSVTTQKLVLRGQTRIPDERYGVGSAALTVTP